MGIVRLMRLEDLDQIMPLEEQLQLHPWQRAAFQQALRLNQFCIVYDEEGIIQGYGVSDKGHGRTVAAINIEAADALYSAWLTAAKNSGVDKLWAEIEVGNRAARMRLKRFGFRMVGLRPSFYGPGKDAQVWERETVQDSTKEIAANGPAEPEAESA